MAEDLVEKYVAMHKQKSIPVQGQENKNVFGFFHDKDKKKIGYDASEYIDYFGDKYDIPVNFDIDYSKERVINDVRASAQGMTVGTSDEIEAFLTSLGSDKKYSEVLPEIRQKINNYKLSNPGASLTSELLGSIIIGKAFIGKTGGATARRVLGGGTAYSIAGADPQSDPRIQKDLTLAESARIRTEEGGKGALFTLPFAWLSKIMQPSREALNLSNKGIKLTSGQLAGGEFQALENVAEKLPFIGGGIKTAKKDVLKEFNEIAFKELTNDLGNALKQTTVNGKTIGIKFPKIAAPKGTGNNMFNSVENKIGIAYDKILDKLIIKDKNSFQSNLENILNSYEGQLPIGIKKQLNKIILNRFNNKDVLTGNQLKRAHSKIRERHRRANNGSAPDSADLTDMYKDVLDLFGTNIKKYNPKIAFQYNALDAAYPKFLTLEKAVNSTKGSNYFFTPEQLISAGKSASKASSSRQIARGKAPYSALGREGEEVIGSGGAKDMLPFYAMMALGGGAGGYAGSENVSGSEAIGLAAKTAIPLSLVGASYKNPAARKILADLLRKNVTARMSPTLAQQEYFGLRNNSGN
jgi:hypothetical protein